jgi:hypothetical protein
MYSFSLCDTSAFCASKKVLGRLYKWPTSTTMHEHCTEQWENFDDRFCAGHKEVKLSCLMCEKLDFHCR